MLKKTLILMGLTVGVALAADDQWRSFGGGGGGFGADDRYDRDRGRSGYGYASRGQYGRMDPVSAALRDLDSVYRRARVDRHEADHFRDAMEALSRFQHEASRGRFDRGRLDRAIDEMKDLAQADQLHPRDRAVLRDRLFDLRRFRDGGGRYRY